jgi:two-component system sensor histidine kinase UhpB
MDTELNILIIEDVPDDAAAIETELRQEGVRFRARRVENREAFLSELRRSTPDIILSDFNLPEFDGLAALHLLQKLQFDIPFILVTGPRSEEVAVECMRNGADDYILKDNLKRLPSALHNALRKKAAEQDKILAEAALRRSEEQFRVITENTRDLISLLDLESRFLYASPSFEMALGYAPAELCGTDSLALVHPDDRASLRETWRQAMLHKDQRVAEVRLRHLKDRWLIFESVGTWVFDDAGRPQRAIIVSRDVTRRKQAEEKLRSLPRLILEAQELERRRVARELHDSVNQVLSSVKFRIASIEEKLLERDESIWRDALKAKFLLEKAIEEVIRISRNLRPSELDDLGLPAAVRSLCDEFAERTGLDLHKSIQRLPAQCAQDIELNLYRIIQESFNNIEKHARATRVDLSLGKEGSLLRAVIRDNGQGFDPHLLQAHKPAKNSMGLVDMQERAVFLGGTCTVTSVLGRGTEVAVSVPYSGETHPKNREKK